MTIWLVHIPQSKWEFKLFDDYATETELLVIAEHQEKSVFCFICFHSPWTESHATSHLVQMKVQRVCKSGAEWERQAVEGKPWFLFPFVTSLGCYVAIKVEPAIGSASHSSFESEYLSSSGRKEHVEIELGIRSWSLMMLMDVLPFWYWQILQKHVCISRSPVRKWRSFWQWLTTFFFLF